MEVNLSKAVPGYGPVTDGAVEGEILEVSEVKAEDGETVTALRFRVKVLDRTTTVFLNTVPNQYQDEEKVTKGIVRALESVGYKKSEIAKITDVTTAMFEGRTGQFEFSTWQGKQKLRFVKPYTFTKLVEEGKVAALEGEIDF